MGLERAGPSPRDGGPGRGVRECCPEVGLEGCQLARLRVGYSSLRYVAEANLTAQREVSGRLRGFGADVQSLASSV